MADPWKSVFFELPTNNEIVWIRVLNIYGPPVLAQWKQGTRLFTTVTTSVKLEAKFVARWKSQ